MTEVWWEERNGRRVLKECAVFRSSRGSCKRICILCKEFSMMTYLPDTPPNHTLLAALPPPSIFRAQGTWKVGAVALNFRQGSPCPQRAHCLRGDNQRTFNTNRPAEKLKQILRTIPKRSFPNPQMLGIEPRPCTV
jgi:hypothetical protein